MLVWLLTSAGIMILFLSGVSFLLTNSFFQLIHPETRSAVHHLLVEVTTVAGMLAAFKLITASLLFFNQITFVFTIMPMPRHICGGPTNFQGFNCEAQQQWDRDYKIAAERYDTWIMTPPWLRQPCDSVAPRVCDAIKANPILDAWPQYIIQILIILLSGLSCGAVTHWVFKSGGIPSWIKRYIVAPLQYWTSIDRLSGNKSAMN